jgi:hypothetical protein
MRQHALRAHFIYNVKRDANAKVRVVVNGKRQHESTFTDTTSPVASQFQLRTFLALTALRLYYMIQMDLTNAYLHADIVDDVYIVIPPCFPGTGEIGRLDKATYGTRQGARRFYDHTVNVLTHIGFTQSKNEPCLFRYIDNEDAAFLLLYVDDALIVGPKHIVQIIEKKIMIYFDSKFNLPKDFLGLDVQHDILKGTIQLSMSSFTNKMKETFKITDSPTILTPGRTDRKIIRGQDVQPDDTYRSKQSRILNVGNNGDTIRHHLRRERTIKGLTRTHTDRTQNTSKNLHLRYPNTQSPPPFRSQRNDYLHSTTH